MYLKKADVVQTCVHVHVRSCWMVVCPNVLCTGECIKHNCHRLKLKLFSSTFYSTYFNQGPGTNVVWYPDEARMGSGKIQYIYIDI